MTIRVGLSHKTSYLYDRPVTLSPQVVRLRPAPHNRTPIVGYSLKIKPDTHFINWQQDPYSNYQARLVFPETTREFSVEVDLVADLTAFNPFDFFVEKYAEKYPFEYPDDLRKELGPYLKKLPQRLGIGKKFKELVEQIRKQDITINDYLVEINQLINKEVKYLIRLEPGVQKPEQTLKLGSGSCRDSAWLQVQVLRALGLAARFVSGYLIQLSADEKSLDGPSGPEKDFTDLHAWTEVFIPGAGWIGLDATSGLLTSEGHIPLACTADPSSAAPISGGVDECEVDFDFAMSVTRLHEDPRVTKPYTEEQWQKIEALGHQVDEELTRSDVRLTMGGEPTFVSIDDMASPEWNTEALGARKRELSGQLLKRLRARFAQNQDEGKGGGGGGVLQYGLGKWYPGESLPRWSLACYWRKDGVPVWNNLELMAQDDQRYGYNSQTAQTFIHELAARLGVGEKYIQPGFEDTWYYLWKEHRLPVNVDPFKNKLENKEDRARLAKIFEQGLQRVVGYTLPLGGIRNGGEIGEGGASWQSSPWSFRGDRMYLLPGDSPMGLRLPLDSLVWQAENKKTPFLERDPWDPREPLPQHFARHFQTSHPQNAGGVRAFNSRGNAEVQGYAGQSLALATKPRLADARTVPLPLVRTALCAEVRDGCLYVFIPPVERLEHYLDLVAQIEQTAAYLKTPVVIEGYSPPFDPRLNTLKVTPDPGVIEVNVHPASSWNELVSNTTALYEEARLCRLGTDKFQQDGRHTGTGGGNHIVIGGATPADSPFLRRPDLLKSLVSYWHNHPALSYLFSGMFIGPTSQAPRADEGRRDLVYELEIALSQLPEYKAGQQPYMPPWLVDRVLRHLLVDGTGNTHRSEFCIDKLYSPDSSTGRLGLVEFRGFEMPPHARMSLTQQLLLRSMLAKFWKEPYEHKLVRWGSDIHDRFMLPHFVMQDFKDVISELQSSGYPLQSEWFNPHLEFRFPRHGEVNLDGVRLELRQAIEPWYVLGEEATGGGTARYVDSSVERMQVKIQGMVNSRHQLACNGYLVPLHPTGRNGEFVAGVRYRAWQPPSCLHPNIGVHAPLVFDLIDRWNRKAIGGCTYYVSHPGGRAYDDFPVNALAAESRRIGRFFTNGHTPGRMDPQPSKQSLEFPFTLDLRWVNSGAVSI